MHCRDVMTGDVYTCKWDSSVLEVASAMREGDIGFAPVVDSEERPIGTVTDRDLCIGIVAVDKPATTPVGEVMHEGVVTCNVDDTLEDAENLMSRHKVQRVVVVDHGGRCRGVISLCDVAVAEHDSNRAHHVMRSVHVPNFTQRKSHLR